MRVCTKCGSAQCDDEFYIIRATGKRREQCRTCVKATVIAWQRNNPERHLAKQRRSNLKQRYGLTTEQYEALLTHQGGGCAICNEKPRLPKRPLVVDHCHQTGQVRGLLCHTCNRGLGMMQDSTDLLRRALTYLKD